jgi:hypothetical protein
MEQAVSTNPGLVIALLNTGDKYKAWTMLHDRDGRPFTSFNAFCETPTPFGLGTSPAKLDDLRKLLDSSRTTLAALSSTSAPNHGGKRDGSGRKLPESLQNNQAYHGKLDSSEAKHGNRAEYLASRIARDAPDVLEAMKAGAFPSVRAAAKAAGILRDPDPVRVASRAIAKVPSERVHELVSGMPKSVRRALLDALTGQVRS